MGHRKKQSCDWRSHRTANAARTPSRKWDLNSNKLTAGKEIQCGSILSSRLWKGGLRVADYFERAIVIKFQGNCCIDRILNVVKQLVHASVVCMSKNKALRKFGEHSRSFRCSRLLPKQLYFVGLKLFTEFSCKKRCPKERELQLLQQKNPVIVLMKDENHFFADEKRMFHYGLKRALLMWASWEEKLGALAN